MTAANQASTSAASDLPQWGRVLIAGGTDWPNLGRKASKSGPPQTVNPEQPDLQGPHILRSVSNVRMSRVHTSHSSCHAVLVSVDGDAYIIGRNEQGQCGLSTKNLPNQPSGPAIWDTVKLGRATHFAPPLPADQKGDIVYAATGRSHTILVTAAGSVYATGLNSSGQCGLPLQNIVEGFQKIETAPFIREKDPVVAASCGVTFSMLLTASGKVYAMGSSEKGQLGNGRTGEHFISGTKLAFDTFDEPFLVKALADKKILELHCGQQHTIARDDNGYVYTWGFGGYGRLGLGTQQDQLAPTLVPQFARENTLTRATHIYAGPTNSAVIDGQRMFWLAGKWKNSGEGSAGQGFMTFKYLPDLMGCKIRNAGLGGVTLFCTADEDPSVRGDHDATMNVCWGQNAHHGELGLGEGKPRSAVKPMRCETLDGLSILDIGAGQSTTYYIARNLGPTYAELARFPEVVPSSDACVVCNSDASSDENALLECEKCENPWHLQCLDPRLSEVPEGEWHCPRCVVEGLGRAATAKASTTATSAPPKNGTKRSAPAADEPAAATGDGQQEGDDETAAATAGMTRKGSRSAPKRRRA
ncbi:uncharacterized protein PFL1_05632 [Pseudozyma flocculosa PF-1]|uniref:Related to SRM1 \|nr:uncharacterized protein PFL1_05632 [Pseudozyma flocculosa PF-1]EPQ26652.1 hypothetical protein PFL1_05632 [Pseudozyma flocculosa PF-1]SPO42184.1 related to SRM1 \